MTFCIIPQSELTQREVSPEHAVRKRKLSSSPGHHGSTAKEKGAHLPNPFGAGPQSLSSSQELEQVTSSAGSLFLGSRAEKTPRKHGSTGPAAWGRKDWRPPHRGSTR